MDWMYIILAFVLSIIFWSLVLDLPSDNVNIYLLAMIMTLIFNKYRTFFRLCIFILIILFIYFIKKPI